MSFTDEEIAYLRSQPLARLATVSSDGQPDVAPVAFEYDGTYFYVGGHGDPGRTRKFRNVQGGNAKVALTVDDLAAVKPWTPRFLRIYGTGELVERVGRFGSGTYLRIAPAVSWSWNLGPTPWAFDPKTPTPPTRRAVHEPASPR